MNSDGHTTFVETWLMRIAPSFKQVGAGFLLFVLAFPLLFWNEQGTIQLARDFDRDHLDVETVEAGDWSAAQGHSLVYVTGQVTTNEELIDADFRIRSRAVKMRRIVECYQWKEITVAARDDQYGRKGKAGVRYAKVWSPNPIDSAKFQQSDVHVNPQMPLRSKDLVAKEVRLGAFKLNFEQVARIDEFVSLPVSADMVSWLPEDRRVGLEVRDNQLVFSQKSADAPQIGDTRVRYSAVRPQWVSVLASPTDESFQAFVAENGKEIDVLKLGVVPLSDMAEFPSAAGGVGVWILRVFGFASMALGLALVFQPIVSMTSLMPLLQDFLGRGLNAFAVCLAAAGSLMTISVAWMYYQPVFSLILSAVAAAIMFGFFILCRIGGRQPAAT